MRQYRTLGVLMLAQCFAQTAAPVVVLLGGIVGAVLAPSTSLATLPVALMIVGTAATTVPAALLMGRFGRKAGFLLGAGAACASGLVAAHAIHVESFVLFCLATFLVGANNAFVQQYRFAVAESVPSARVAPALSFLMLAGVVAAVLGPETASRMADFLAWGTYSGSFIGMSGLMACTMFVLLFYTNQPPPEMPGTAAGNSQDMGRPLIQIVTRPMFVMAVGAAVVGYGVMSLVMTATPVSMHVHDGFSLDDTAWVIQSHIMAMYLPSLFSGFLIARFGAIRMITVGVGLLFLCLLIAFIDHKLMHYWWALVLLGVGWNFLFVGGTTLLTQTYLPAERFKVQALNDFLVFSLQALAALGSGVILNILGWYWLLGMGLPWLLLLLPVIYVASQPRPAIQSN